MKVSQIGNYFEVEDKKDDINVSSVIARFTLSGEYMIFIKTLRSGNTWPGNKKVLYSIVPVNSVSTDNAGNDCSITEKIETVMSAYDAIRNDDSAWSERYDEFSPVV